ncbi:hypothetical protein K3727_09485 [Rhodobacteraceae bacterium M382]|nr:hypothetical protein K3727_09485 [Rhodobacteraceae bacterium M382]
MNTREQLEARAKELEVKFAANISDEKLQERVDAAEAKAQKSQTGPDNGGTGDTGDTGDKGQTNNGGETGEDDLIDTDVLERVKHDGRDYGPGDPISLNTDTYLELLGLSKVAEVDIDPDT